MSAADDTAAGAADRGRPVLPDAAAERAHAHSALNRALISAEETEALRAFLDVPGVPRLLAHDSGRFGRLGPLADRLRRDARAQTDHASPPLTPKELELLSDLPALLTLEEIADRHQVSVNTVKTHVRSIYQKLGAGSRREALATARHRGLL